MADSVPLNDPELATLEVGLVNRMVAEGQWADIQQKLKVRLNEMGWLDQLKSKAKEKARSQQNLSFEGLYSEVSPWAQENMPSSVRQEILAEIQKYVTAQVEGV